MKKNIFTGAGVAIITPFDEAGNINFSELGKIIDNQISEGKALTQLLSREQRANLQL